MRRSDNPSIKDVAEVAGVSFKTVSRVLNGDAGVSETLRKRVEAAVPKVGYVANAGARVLRSGRSGVVGFLSDVITTTPYSFEIVRGAQDALNERGLSMLIANTQHNPETESRQLALFLENRVRGIIYSAMFHQEVAMPKIPDDVNVVMLNCFDSLGRYPAVVPDDEQIGRTAAEYLISKGHQRIAYLTLPKQIVATPLRNKGFLEAIKKAGLPKTGINIKASRRFRPGGDEISLARELTESLFASSEAPTAILAANDPEAMPIVMTLHRLGLAIPEDVSVLGIDDYRLICERLDPPLSSIALPYYQMGRRSVERLLDSETSAPLVERIPGPLVERQSVAEPRKK